jgi:hypothetical protein
VGPSGERKRAWGARCEKGGAGRDLTPLYHGLVHGREPPDHDALLAPVGLTVVGINNGVYARWEVRQGPTPDEAVATPCREALGSSLIVPPAAW